MKTAALVIGFMFSGILLGYLFRRTKVTLIQKLITFFIWLLLFLLGVHAGGNEEVVRSLGTIGFEAVIITIAAIFGSSFCALLLWKFLNKKPNDKEGNLESKNKGE